MNRVYILLFCVIGFCLILTVVFNVKYYKLCKTLVNPRKEILPGCFWYFVYCVCILSFFLIPVAFFMVWKKYRKLKKFIKDSENSSMDKLSPNLQKTSTEEHPAILSNINKEEGGLFREEDIVDYQINDDKIICNLDPKAKYRHRIERKVLIKGFDYVHKGDKLVQISIGRFGESITLYALEDGYFVDGASQFGYSYYSGDYLFTIYKTVDTLQQELFPVVFVIGEDGFTKYPYIKAKKHCGNEKGFFIGRIYIRIEYANGKHKLNLDFCSKDIVYTKKQSLHFLMDNGDVLSFKDFTTPIRYDGNGEINKTTSTIMTYQDIQTIAEHQLVKWQMINNEGSILYEVDFPPQKYPKKEVYRRILQCYALEYLSSYDVIKQTVEEKTVEEEDIKGQHSPSVCFVYLMIDTTNHFHKIGISNNPRYREHTLQSDKPTIELVCAKEYPSRAIAEAIEASLHKVFADKRIRGEWFNLNNEDVENIKQTLK